MRERKCGVGHGAWGMGRGTFEGFSFWPNHAENHCNGIQRRTVKRAEILKSKPTATTTKKAIKAKKG